MDNLVNVTPEMMLARIGAKDMEVMVLRQKLEAADQEIKKLRSEGKQLKNKVDKPKK